MERKNFLSALTKRVLGAYQLYRRRIAWLDVRAMVVVVLVVVVAAARRSNGGACAGGQRVHRGVDGVGGSQRERAGDA